MQGRRPSQIRAEILEDHARLRILLAELDEVAQRVFDGDEALAFRLRVLAEAMRERFLEHLDLEDELLVPALREIEPGGPDRARQVAEDHREQRQRFASLLEGLSRQRQPLKELAGDLRALVADLLLEMTQEERSVFDWDLFRNGDLGSS